MWNTDRAWRHGAFTRAIVDEEMQRRVYETRWCPVGRWVSWERPLSEFYAGLMIGEDGPKVIEFNARFGDPEAPLEAPHRFGR